MPVILCVKNSSTIQIYHNIQNLIEFATQLRNVGLVVPYESLVEPNSLIIGKSLGELNFWHNTGATIVGIKRGEQLFLSPGPYFTINEKDIVVYVGQNEDVIGKVKNYITSIKEL